MIATGVAEEKSSRIMEIMVSVSADRAHGCQDRRDRCSGLLQFGIWIVTGLSLNALAKSGI